MFYWRVSSLPEVKALPAEARDQLLKKHIGPRFYFTLLGKAGILGALVYVLLVLGLPRMMAPPLEPLQWIAWGAGIVTGLMRYGLLMMAFRRQLQDAMERD